MLVALRHDYNGLFSNFNIFYRVILNKVLTATSEPLRLYATQLMLVLLRAHVQDFHKWGIEMLVMQLYDQAKAVSLAAINVLMEACEEKVGKSFNIGTYLMQQNLNIQNVNIP